MSHRRPPLVRALQLNTAVLVVEIAAGIGSNSFSLIMDGVHNLSDEVALVLLVLAYSLTRLRGFAGERSSKWLKNQHEDLKGLHYRAVAEVA